MSAPLVINAELGKPVHAVVSGVAAPGAFRVVRGLPPGMTVDLRKGTMSGTPEQPGVFLFEVTQPAGRPNLRVEVRVLPGPMFVPREPAPVEPPVPVFSSPIYSPPAAAPQLTGSLDDFLRLDKPCPIPGCEELRVRYKESLDKLTSTGCSACQTSALKQKFANEYRKLLASV